MPNNEKKLCPLFAINPKDGDLFCVGDECSWWVIDRCAIAAIAGIENAIGLMADCIPRQPR